MSEDEIPCKRTKIEETNEDQSTANAVAAEEQTEINVAATSSQTPNANVAALPQPRPKLLFKNPKFSYIEPGGKKFVWKSLKQIVTQEKALPWPEDVVLCKFIMNNTVEYINFHISLCRYFA